MDIVPEALDDLKAAQKSRAYFKAAGLNLQFFEVYCLHRGLRSLVRREVTRFFEQTGPTRPPDVPPDILERLRLVRHEAGPVVSKLRRYTASAVGASALPELHEMAISILLSTAQGRDLAVGWLESPARFEQEAAAEMKRIAGIVESFHAGHPAEAPAAPAPAAVPVVAPETPAGLTATSERDQISLSWSPSKGAGTYTVRRSTDSGGPYQVLVEKFILTGFIDQTLSNGATVYYTVSASNAGLESPPSSPLRVVRIPAPAAPAGLEARPGKGGVELRWTPSPGAALYRIKRSGAPIGEGVEATYRDASAESGKTYGYAVSALNEGGESPDSTIVQVRVLAVPSAPTGLAAQGLSARVTLSWGTSKDAERYTVKRSLGRDGRYVSIASGIPDSSYVDTTAANGTTYFYVVAAVNGAGESADSAAVEATPVEPPKPPGGLSAVQSGGSVVLSWTPSRQAASYTVKRGTARGGPYDTVASKLTQCSYKDDRVTPGLTFTYVVHSVQGRVGGPKSAEVEIQLSAPPGAPTELAAAPGLGVLTLTWKPVPGATGYQVRRSEGLQGPDALLADTREPRHEDREVMFGKEYHYAVIARNVGGESPRSAPLTASLDRAPDRVKELKAAPGNGHVVLSWPASKGALTYQVRRSSEPGGPLSVIATIGALTTFLDRAVENGRPYDYAVLAIGAGGESALSHAVRAVPLGPPSAPTGLELSPGDGKVLLTWAAVKGATSYRIKRSTSGGPRVVIGSSEERTYTDTSVANGTTYRYAVVAVNGGGEGPESSELVGAPVDPPSQPVGLVASPGARQISLAWFPSPGATGYAIKRSTSPDGPWHTIAQPSDPSYVDAGLQGGTRYYYVINALNPAGRSPNSDRVDGTTTG